MVLTHIGIDVGRTTKINQKREEKRIQKLSWRMSDENVQDRCIKRDVLICARTGTNGESSRVMLLQCDNVFLDTDTNNINTWGSKVID